MVLLHHVFGDQDLVDFVRPIGEAQRACTLVHPDQWKVAGDSGSAPNLDCTVDNPGIPSTHWESSSSV